jgi:osmotically-inducible protein OsmY
MGSENRLKKRHYRSSQEGVVTLSGFVHSYWEKDAGGKAAKGVYGVREAVGCVAT